MAESHQQAMAECLRVMMRPMVRFCLKHSLGIQEMLDTAKLVFVDLAAEELKRQGEKVTTSRLSVMTGMQRPAVKKYKDFDPAKIRTNRFTARVIAQWRRDPKFLTKNNRPRVLSYEGDDSEFRELVHIVSTDLHPRTVLFDLERLGVIEIGSSGVRLRARAYKAEADSSEVYAMAARDVEELLGAVMDNAEVREELLPNFHAYTYMDNISEEDLPKIRDWINEKCAAFHQKVETYLSKYDLDLSPNPDKEGGKKVAFGSYSRTTTPKS